MRMWMLPPSMLGRQRLLGEHGEIHKFRHTFVKKYKIDGRISPVVQIEPAMMQIRHDELAEEMIRRGMNHQSPYELPDLSYLPEHQRNAKVDLTISYNDLIDRCPDSANRIMVHPRDWYFTFGFGQWPHLDNCYTVINGTYASAREGMVATYGDKWAFQYALPELAGVERFNLKRV